MFQMKISTRKSILYRIVYTLYTVVKHSIIIYTCNFIYIWENVLQVAKVYNIHDISVYTLCNKCLL